MKGLLKVIYNIIRGIVRAVLFLLLLLVQRIIYVVTFEPGTKREITVRKARRIRALSKLKFVFLNALPEPVHKFLGTGNYRNYLNKHIGNGLQLRYE